MTWALTFTLVCVGGALGALLRAYFSKVSVGILGANLIASFALGLLNALDSSSLEVLERSGGALRIALGVGLLGALSTWSSLALEVIELLHAKKGRTAVLVLVTHIAGGVTAAWVGLRLGTTLS